MRRRDPVVSVTTARRSPAQDLRHRERQYVITMSIRTACFLLAAFLPVPVAVKLMLIFASLVLPWIAVTYANGGQRIEDSAARFLEHPQRLELGSASDPARTVSTH